MTSSAEKQPLQNNQKTEAKIWIVRSLKIGTLYIHTNIQASSLKYLGEEANFEMRWEALKISIGGCEPWISTAERPFYLGSLLYRQFWMLVKILRISPNYWNKLSVISHIWQFNKQYDRRDAVTIKRFKKCISFHFSVVCINWNLHVEFIHADYQSAVPPLLWSCVM